MATIPKIRIWYPSEVEVFNNSTIDRLQKLGYRVYAITVEGVIAGSDGATSFDDATTVLDGTSTADTMFIESTDALDRNAAAGAVQSVIINIVNSSGDPYRSSQAMDASDGTTAVECTDTAVRLYNFYSVAWGTGGQDAEGNITLGDDAVPTNTFETITAANNESDGARIWVPDGYKSIIENVTISIQDKALAAVNNGCFIQIDKQGFEASDNTSPDASAPVVVACVGSQGYVSTKPQHYPDTGTDGAYYLLKESRVTGDETCMCYMLFILYKDARDGL
jgi:hypothetical protein